MKESTVSMKDFLEPFGVISELANVYRHNGMTFAPGRKENVAEHSYALATFGCALAQAINETNASQLDLGKVAQFALVHDMTEIYMKDGDISVYSAPEMLASKKDQEEEALAHLEMKTVGLPWIAEMLKEYESQASREACFVYALDKMIVHMVVILNDTHHAVPTFNRYLETEDVAREKIQKSFPELLPYFKELCQMFRKRPHLFKDENNQ